MTINQLLKYTPQEYERLMFETYFAYVEIISSSDEDVQKVLANNAYHKWYMQEYRNLEAEFLKEIQPYIGKVDVETIRDFYDEKTMMIAASYSKHLLAKARKTNIINQPQLN